MSGSALVVRRPTPRWKRLTDVVVAAVALVVAAPVLTVVAGAIALTLGRPVLFRQRRGGHGGAEFSILKFRTMTEATDAAGTLLPDAQRRHWLGDLLRRTSLDELPTLWNILRGDMSIVGPRPLFAKYLGRYDDRQARRHEVVPGLTGLAQVRGRNALTWDEKFELDLYYVEHRSPVLDLRIVLETVRAVFTGEGADGAELTEEFRGTSAPSSAAEVESAAG